MFGIAVIVGLLVLYVAELFLKWLGGKAPAIAPFVDVLLYIVCALVLIALIYVAGDALFGGGSMLGGLGGRPFRSSGVDGRSLAAYSAAAAGYLPGLLKTRL